MHTRTADSGRFLMALSVPLRPASHQRAAQRTPRAHAAAALRVPLVAVHGHVASRSHGHQAPILRLPRESYILLVEWERSLNLVLVDELELGMPWLLFQVPTGSKLSSTKDVAWTSGESISAVQRTADWSVIGQSHPIRPGAMLGQGAARGQGRCRCGACLWRSCVSGVQCMAQLAVEVGRCGSRGAVRGTQGSGRRDRRARAVLWCTAAGCGWHLLCSSCCATLV